MYTGAVGSLKVYPAMEMLAIDMAEALRAAYTFNGVIQGCQLSISEGELRMSPGRVMLGGRLGVFEPDENKSYVTINLPNSDAKRNICIVCDLRSTSAEGLFFIGLYTNTELTSLNAVCANYTDEEFNTGNGVRYLKIGYVEVSANGQPFNLQNDAKSYPDGVVKTNKNYTDDIGTRELKHWDTLSAWTNYFKTVRHKIGFFRTYTVTADNLTLAGNALGTFKLCKEMNGQTIVKPSSGNPTFPETAPYIYILPNGTYNNSYSKGKQPDNPKPNADERGIPIGLYNKYVNCGIVGVQISNAKTGGANSTSCVIQSYYIDPADEGKGALTVVVRNIGSGPAKIKISVTSLFIRDVDYPTVNPTTT